MSIRGGACWSATYSKQYGADRWKLLLNALAEVPTQLAFVAPHISYSAVRYLLRKPRFVPCLIPNCFSYDAGRKVPETDSKCAGGESAESVTPDSRVQLPFDQNMSENVAIVEDEHVAAEAMAKTYFLDGASALAGFILGARPGEVVLDMCAAPGGKSLIILSMLTQAKVPACVFGNHSMLSEADSVENDDETAGLLVCNDISRDRLARLQNTLNKFLPPYSTAGQRLQFSCADICKGGPFERFAPYDRVLLDAPCSSDRHLLHKGGSAMGNWSLSTPKAHAERQLKMLLIASKLLKKDGILLYSTCALSELENDAVIEKFLKKTARNIKVLPLFDGEWPAEVKLLEGKGSGLCKTTEHSDSSIMFFVEKLKYGYAMLPDVSRFGPMYFCRMQITGH